MRNHPRWIPTRCNRQGDLGGITLEGFTLEVVHDGVVIGGGEGGITLRNPRPFSYTIEIIRSALRGIPSALDSSSAESYN